MCHIGGHKDLCLVRTYATEPSCLVALSLEVCREISKVQLSAVSNAASFPS